MPATALAAKGDKLFFFALAQVFALLINLASTAWHSNREKDLEILLLRRRLAILQRAQPRPPHLTRWEKAGLAVLSAKISRCSTEARARLREGLLLFQPETVLRWHRALVCRKWTFRRRHGPGRPRTSVDLGQLILRMAGENPRWGYRRLRGELRKLGHRVARATISAVLRRHRFPPAPTRGRGGRWRTVLRHFRQEVLARDFFSVEPLFLHTVFVLFFIEVRARKVILAGCPEYPTASWVTQQAQQLNWAIQDGKLRASLLRHDRNGKFRSSVGAVFRSEGLAVVHRRRGGARRTAAPSGRCARSARSAWTGCSSSTSDICCACLRGLSPSTTRGARIKGWINPVRFRSVMLRAEVRSDAEMYLGASCMIIIEQPPDGSIFGHYTFDPDHNALSPYVVARQHPDSTLPVRVRLLSTYAPVCSGVRRHQDETRTMFDNAVPEHQRGYRRGAGSSPSGVTYPAGNGLTGPRDRPRR